MTILNEMLKKDKPIDEFDEFVFQEIQKELPLSTGQIIEKLQNLLPYIGASENDAKLYYNVFKYNFREDGKYSEISWRDFKGPKEWASKRTTTRNTREYVNARQQFHAPNLKGEWKTDWDGNEYYVVYSYGYYPIYIFKDGIWYGNEDSYSRTTGKHMSYSRPSNGKIYWLSRREMEDLERSGTVEKFIEKRKETLLSNKKDLKGQKFTFKDYYNGIRVLYTIDGIEKRGNKIKLKITITDVFKADRNLKPKSDENYLLGEIPNVTKEYVENIVKQHIANNDRFLYLIFQKDPSSPKFETFDFVIKHLKEQ